MHINNYGKPPYKTNYKSISPSGNVLALTPVEELESPR